MDSEIGSIEVGKKADIIVVDVNKIEMIPCVDPIVNVVHNGFYNCVDTVIINGNTLIKNSMLQVDIDLDELKDMINDIRNKLMQG